MTTSNAVSERLGTLFADTFHVEVPGWDVDLVENGLLDSFQFVELLFQLEKEFGLRIDIQDLDLDDLRTLERITRLITDNAATQDGDPNESAARVRT